MTANRVHYSNHLLDLIGLMYDHKMTYIRDYKVYINPIAKVILFASCFT